MTDWDVAVVGAGIAGLTAARAAAQHGHRVIAYDELAPGGQLVNLARVSDYPGVPEGASGPELAAAVLESALAAGVEIGYGAVTGLRSAEVVALDTEAGAVTSRAVVVATGRTPGSLALAGAGAGAGDWAGRGLSSCASCDGPLFAGRPVAVVGDDEWAAREAVELAELAARVTLLVPDLPRWSAAAGRQLADRVEVRAGSAVTALLGGDTLAGVRLADGTELPVAGLFTASGRTPRAELFDGIPGDGSDGVFTAGEVRADCAPYLVAAAADGLRAGLDAVAWCRGKGGSTECASSTPLVGPEPRSTAPR